MVDTILCTPVNPYAVASARLISCVLGTLSFGTLRMPPHAARAVVRRDNASDYASCLHLTTAYLTARLPTELLLNVRRSPAAYSVKLR